jgi:hypothetical protein
MSNPDVWEGFYLASGQSTKAEQTAMLGDAAAIIHTERLIIEREQPVGVSTMWTCVQPVRSPDGSFRSCFSKHPSEVALNAHKRYVHGEK